MIRVDAKVFAFFFYKINCLKIKHKKSYYESINNNT